MNTPIQEAIEQIKEKHLKWFKDKDDLNLTLRERGMQDAYINSIRILESLVSVEQDAFMDFGIECQSEIYCTEESITKAFKKAVEVFNDTYIKD